MHEPKRESITDQVCHQQKHAQHSIEKGRQAAKAKLPITKGSQGPLYQTFNPTGYVQTCVIAKHMCVSSFSHYLNFHICDRLCISRLSRMRETQQI